jgi:hypothetical protein
MSEPEQTNDEARRAQDLRTMEAVAGLYRKHDVEPSPALFDDEETAMYRPDQLALYVELMGRPPLHSDRDRALVGQVPRRRR